MHGSLDNANSFLPALPSRYPPADILGPMSEKAISGEKVRALRKARGWTQMELAQASGVSQSALSRIERGDSDGSYASTLRALARAFGCAEGDLSDGAPLDIQMIPSDDAAPTHASRPDVDELAAEVVAWGTVPEVYVRDVIASGSMQALNIPLTAAALEELAKVVQRHAQRRRR